jgi:hypothetical protein
VKHVTRKVRLVTCFDRQRPWPVALALHAADHAGVIPVDGFCRHEGHNFAGRNTNGDVVCPYHGPYFDWYVAYRSCDPLPYKIRTQAELYKGHTVLTKLGYIPTYETFHCPMGPPPAYLLDGEWVSSGLAWNTYHYLPYQKRQKHLAGVKNTRVTAANMCRLGAPWGYIQWGGNIENMNWHPPVWNVGFIDGSAKMIRSMETWESVWNSGDSNCNTHMHWGYMNRDLAILLGLDGTPTM